ncbi:MAG: trypsin-like serine protease, partial [Actinomycetota bacterium]|nr:trypsin-like serine protease [Actinomycetota bacterium]
MAGGPAALAATKRLPIKAGPNGLSRAPGAIGPKIVGGQPVPNGKYRFQAALLAQSFGTNDWERQYCGGSLISPFDVLTAAHCVEFVGVPGGIPLSDLRVVVGRTVLTSTQGQKRRAAAISIHPRWDPTTFSFDVAVVHLASPINGIR